MSNAKRAGSNVRPFLLISGEISFCGFFCRLIAPCANPMRMQKFLEKKII